MFKHTRIDKQYIDYLHLRCKYGMIGGNPSMYDSEMGRYSSGSFSHIGPSSWEGWIYIGYKIANLCITDN
jgi:hypothetical protein